MFWFIGPDHYMLLIDGKEQCEPAKPLLNDDRNIEDTKSYRFGMTIRLSNDAKIFDFR